MTPIPALIGHWELMLAVDAVSAVRVQLSIVISVGTSVGRDQGSKEGLLPRQK